MSRLVPKLRFKEFSGEWEDGTLEGISEIVRGGSPRPIDKYMTLDKDALNWLKIADVDKNSKYVTFTKERVKKTALSKTREVHPNDLILSNSMSFGRPYIMKIKSCIHDGWIAVTNILKDINTHYLYYIILSPISQKFFVDYAAGGGIRNLNADIIKSLPVSFSKDPKEQQKIASCLSSLDALIEAQNKKVSALKQHKKGLMQQLFPAEGKREPKLRFKAFSGEWGEKMLEEIGEISGGGVDKKTNENERPVMLLNYMDVYNKNFIYSYDLKQQTSANNAKIQKCNIEKGDIFFTPSSEVPNDIAKSSVAMESIINGVYSYHLVRLRMFKSLDLKFRTYMFKTNSFFKIVSKLAQGSGTRYTITLPEFRSIKTLIPPPPKEQQKIANTLSTLDSLIEAQNQQINHLKQHKKGLMQQLFVNSEVGA